MKHVGILVAICLGLSGCGDSGLNPFSWFAQEEEVETLSDARLIVVEDARPRVPSVTSVRVDRTPGGAIIRATGLPPTQGWHSAALIPRNDGAPNDGILTFDFRAAPPETPTRGSTVQSRELVVGYAMSDVALSGVRSIRVVGASNILVTRR